MTRFFHIDILLVFNPKRYGWFCICAALAMLLLSKTSFLDSGGAGLLFGSLCNRGKTFDEFRDSSVLVEKFRSFFFAIFPPQKKETMKNTFWGELFSHDFFPSFSGVGLWEGWECGQVGVSRFDEPLLNFWTMGNLRCTRWFFRGFSPSKIHPNWIWWPETLHFWGHQILET